MEVLKSAVKTTNATTERQIWKTWFGSSKLLNRNRLQKETSVSHLSIVTEKHLRELIAQHVDTGNHHKAIDLLTQLIRHNPDSAIDYNNRGSLYLHQELYTEAIADLNRALDLDPTLDNAYNNRASCYARIGNISAALADYEMALDLNPSNVRTWINQGITFRELGIYDLAIENFEIALALGKKHQGRIYAERGRAYHARGDWNCAVADYYRALNLLEDSSYRAKIQGYLDGLLQPLMA
jgi:tetratricopeptide (TPR) repeat protein